jgi:hypothetical protein
MHSLQKKGKQQEILIDMILSVCLQKIKKGFILKNGNFLCYKKAFRSKKCCRKLLASYK